MRHAPITSHFARRVALLNDAVPAWPASPLVASFEKNGLHGRAPRARPRRRRIGVLSSSASSRTVAERGDNLAGIVAPSTSLAGTLSASWARPPRSPCCASRWRGRGAPSGGAPRSSSCTSTSTLANADPSSALAQAACHSAPTASRRASSPRLIADARPRPGAVLVVDGREIVQTASILRYVGKALEPGRSISGGRAVAQRATAMFDQKGHDDEHVHRASKRRERRRLRLARRQSGRRGRGRRGSRRRCRACSPSSRRRSAVDAARHGSSAAPHADARARLPRRLPNSAYSIVRAPTR